MENQNEEAQNNQAEGQFMIQRVYLKNLSYETSETPAIFQQDWKPELNLDLHTTHTALDSNGTYEVVLQVTATVKNADKTAFLVEVHQAGIFSIQGPKDEQLSHLLGSFCPSILFPYARETISSEVTRGSFPQLVLAPVNFDALYMQQNGAKANEEQAH